MKTKNKKIIKLLFIIGLNFNNYVGSNNFNDLSNYIKISPSLKVHEKTCDFKNLSIFIAHNNQLTIELVLKTLTGQDTLVFTINDHSHKVSYNRLDYNSKPIIINRSTKQSIMKNFQEIIDYNKKENPQKGGISWVTDLQNNNNENNNPSKGISWVSTDKVLLDEKKDGPLYSLCKVLFSTISNNHNDDSSDEILMENNLDVSNLQEINPTELSNISSPSNYLMKTKSFDIKFKKFKDSNEDNVKDIFNNLLGIISRDIKNFTNQCSNNGYQIMVQSQLDDNNPKIAAINFILSNNNEKDIITLFFKEDTIEVKIQSSNGLDPKKIIKRFVDVMDPYIPKSPSVLDQIMEFSASCKNSYKNYLNFFYILEFLNKLNYSQEIITLNSDDKSIVDLLNQTNKLNGKPYINPSNNSNSNGSNNQLNIKPYSNPSNNKSNSSITPKNPISSNNKSPSSTNSQKARYQLNDGGPKYSEDDNHHKNQQDINDMVGFCVFLILLFVCLYFFKNNGSKQSINELDQEKHEKNNKLLY